MMRMITSAAITSASRSKQQAVSFGAEVQRRILDLAEQLPRIWQDPRVEARERKRIVRIDQVANDHSPCTSVGRRAP